MVDEYTFSDDDSSLITLSNYGSSSTLKKGFKYINALDIDSDGNIYFSANYNNGVLLAGDVPTYEESSVVGGCIFNFNIADGVITRIAGTDYCGSSIGDTLVDGNLAVGSGLEGAFSIVVDSSKNIYFITRDGGNEVWKIDASNGRLSLFATITAGSNLAKDPNGEIIVSSGCLIQKITTAGVAGIVAGDADCTASEAGN